MNFIMDAGMTVHNLPAFANYGDMQRKVEDGYRKLIKRWKFPEEMHQELVDEMLYDYYVELIRIREDIAAEENYQGDIPAVDLEYKEILGYLDSEQLKIECEELLVQNTYNEALSSMDNGMYQKAMDLFILIEPYGDFGSTFVKEFFHTSKPDIFILIERLFLLHQHSGDSA